MLYICITINKNQTMKNSNEISAGLVMWDIIDGEAKILLCKPGGPYFWKKHTKCYGIPKGLIEPGEDVLAAAIREFEEETSIKSKGPYVSLGEVVYASGKIVHAFAFRGEFKGKIKSNTFSMEWPPKSGKTQEFPEVENGIMLSLEDAKPMIMISQEPLLDKLELMFKQFHII